MTQALVLNEVKMSHFQRTSFSQLLNLVRQIENPIIAIARLVENCI